VLAIGAVAADPFRRGLQAIDHLVRPQGEIADLVAVEDRNPAQPIDFLASHDLGHHRADPLQGASDGPREEDGADGSPGRGDEREEEEVEELPAVITQRRVRDDERHGIAPGNRCVARGKLGARIEDGIRWLSRERAGEAEAQSRRGRKLSSDLVSRADRAVAVRDRHRVERRRQSPPRGLRIRLPGEVERIMVGEPRRAGSEVALNRPDLRHVRGQGEPHGRRGDERERKDDETDAQRNAPARERNAPLSRGERDPAGDGTEEPGEQRIRERQRGAEAGDAEEDGRSDRPGCERDPVHEHRLQQRGDRQVEDQPRRRPHERERERRIVRGAGGASGRLRVGGRLRPDPSIDRTKERGEPGEEPRRAHDVERGDDGEHEQSIAAVVDVEEVQVRDRNGAGEGKPTPKAIVATRDVSDRAIQGAQAVARPVAGLSYPSLVRITKGLECSRLGQPAPESDTERK
jgi:hypothetical protein